MSENEYFMKVGENHWINPFSGNIAYVVMVGDSNGNKFLSIYFSNGQEIRWNRNSLEGKVFIQWLDDNSIDLEKRNDSLSKALEKVKK